MQLPKPLRPFIEKPKRFKIAIGGRGSGKSMSFADIFLMQAQTRGQKVGCFREYQNSIDDSVHALFASEIERLNLKGFEIQAQKILYNNQEIFKFKGLARNSESIKSMHGFEKFWVEEAQTLSYKSLKALTPTLRTEGSEIWMSANPQSSADPFSQRFIKPFEKEINRHGFYEDDMHLIVKINYSDNPFFPSVLEQERAYDEEHLSTAEYLHIWEGHYNDTVDGSIISVDWFNAAIDAHEKLGFKGTGAIIAAFDPSDEGGDNKAVAVRHGSVVLSVLEKEDGDVNTGCDWACDLAIDHNADQFIWDADGLGAGLARQVNDYFRGRKVETDMFKGGETPSNPDHKYNEGKSNKDTFKNKRAQNYWMLRDRFKNTHDAVTRGKYVNPEDMISIPSELECIDQLRSEVCRIPQKYNANGLNQLKSKEDMRKMGIASPNLADALMMTMGVNRVQDESIVMGVNSYW